MEDKSPHSSGLKGQGANDYRHEHSFNSHFFVTENALKLTNGYFRYKNLNHVPASLLLFYGCLPVLSTSAECAMSKLKLVKNRLKPRSHTDDTRFSFACHPKRMKLGAQNQIH